MGLLLVFPMLLSTMHSCSDCIDNFEKSNSPLDNYIILQISRRNSLIFCYFDFLDYFLLQYGAGSVNRNILVMVLIMLFLRSS